MIEVIKWGDIKTQSFLEFCSSAQNFPTLLFVQVAGAMSMNIEEMSTTKVCHFAGERPFSKNVDAIFMD
ncbi:unnamed protein product [Gongylonema pulchrum]|uniref:Glucuronosyltransferase n=1 Tax=Gongylonema pulchrum TaxID=637853 RepID=A0A183DPY0_9BILA|nr:unnamed protein product [Gongylonema pulchrum]